jgi:hypothetical protein
MISVENQARIQELRKELESKWYGGSKGYLKHLENEHRKLVGDVPTSCQVNLRGIIFLAGFSRVVIGSHGPYIEFNEGDCLIPLRVKEGEEWRQASEGSKKYHWLYPVGFQDVKVYHQVRTVDYASYVVGKYYVDLLSVDIP